MCKYFKLPSTFSLYSLDLINNKLLTTSLNDYMSEYKSQLQSLHDFPLMYYFDLLGIMLFIESFKSPSHDFDMRSMTKFSSQIPKLDHSNTSGSISPLNVWNRCIGYSSVLG